MVMTILQRRPSVTSSSHRIRHILFIGSHVDRGRVPSKRDFRKIIHLPDVSPATECRHFVLSTKVDHSPSWPFVSDNRLLSARDGGRELAAITPDIGHVVSDRMPQIEPQAADEVGFDRQEEVAAIVTARV
jgi:hypothetical protein